VGSGSNSAYGKVVTGVFHLRSSSMSWLPNVLRFCNRSVVKRGWGNLDTWHSVVYTVGLHYLELKRSVQDNFIYWTKKCSSFPHSIMKVVRLNENVGRAMAQAVSRRPLTSEARVRSRVSPCGIYGGQSGTGTGFPPSTSVFPCQCLFTGAPLLEKTKKKKTLIIFITGGTISPKAAVCP
jgi:hypothetical protein